MGRIADALRKAQRERVEGGSFPMPGAIPVPNALRAGDWNPSFDPEAIRSVLPEGVEYEDIVADSFVPFFEPASLVSEQYRALRTRLLSQNPHYEHRVLAITSGSPREGKSVTTLNLGATLAEVRHLKILAVDGDFRRSSLARMLGQPKSPGLAEVLKGEATYEEVIRETPVPNLYFIPAGDTKDRSAAELLAGAAAKPIFARMRNDFHYTIIDTPPATTVTDVGIVGQFCHGVIVIVRMNRTHEAVAQQGVRLLRANKIPIIGALIIGRDTSASGYGSKRGSYYDGYYRYYKSDPEEQGKEA